MANSPWIKHVMKYAKDNNIKFGDALKKAGPSYKSQGVGSSTTKKMRKTRGKKGSKKNKTSSRRM